jgi:acyl-CoA reductase-like NAD-dependent aldehyde dehydrogenase
MEPQQMMIIDGERVAGETTFPVTNPSTGECFADAPRASQDQLDRAMRSALGAFPNWRKSDDQRRNLLTKAADLIDAATDRLAPLLTREQGKPIRDARDEVAAAVIWFRYYADLEVARQIVQDDADKYIELIRRPMGVVSAITPWNAPVVLAAWKISQALRAGNTMVLKPSPYTPLSTLLLGEVLAEVFPPGVLNVISGTDELGPAMTVHPIPRRVSFTGSIATGKRVAVSAAADLKRLNLELGGNDPAIILDDVDVETIADSLFTSAFRENGQVCVAVKRVYAHESVHHELVEALAERARNTKIGDGFDESIELGPVNNRPQVDHVADLVDDARNGGATVASGGRRSDSPGYFYAPTILTGISDGARAVDEEQFGPMLPIVSYRDIDDAVARANNTMFGLSASIWSGDPQRAAEIAPLLEAGKVTVNAHATWAMGPHLPLTGFKWSGMGVENGLWGLESYTELQVFARPSLK